MKVCTKCKVEKPLGEFWRRPTKKNPDQLRSWCISCCQARRPYQPTYDAAYRRAHHLQSKYGITQHDYDDMFASQNGRCAICHCKPDDGKFLHIDHDHETLEVRGLLCYRCNSMIGYARENPGILLGGVAYLFISPSFERLTPTIMLGKAFSLADRKHHGQVRKDGTPYINHPIRVMNRVDDDTEKIVALMHDLKEDTDTTDDELRLVGFTNEVIALVDALTKRPGERYDDFITRCIAGGHSAICVKLADIDDNMQDQSALDPDEAAYLREKYIRARARLTAALDKPFGD